MLLLFSILALTASGQYDYPDFTQWSALNNRTYPQATERDYRESVYNNNIVTINKHNAQYPEWKLAPTKYADLTSSEFSMMSNLTNYNISKQLGK